MKKITGFAIKTYNTLIISTFISMAQLAHAETEFTNEFWVSTVVQTNGGNGVYGDGTLECPYDGSTEVKFDTVMNSMPPNCTIHLLAGTFQAKGDGGQGYAWVQTGQKILGSGMDNTIIQLIPNAPGGGGAVFVLDGVGSNIVVADLTLDCNFGSQTITASGIQLFGTHNTVKNVKVINLGCRAGEEFSIALNPAYCPSEGNLVENCVIIGSNPCNPDSGDNGIAFNGNSVYSISGSIRNNHIYGVAHGINGSDENNCLFDGNYIDSAGQGIYGDTDGTTNLLIIKNVFNNCRRCIYFANPFVRQNITVAFNDFVYTPSTELGIHLDSFTYTNVVVMGNSFNGCDGLDGSGNPRTVMHAFNVQGIIFANNTVAAGLVNSFSGCYNVSMYLNYDLAGNLRTDMDTMGFSTLTPYGMSLMSSANSSTALTSLGLPHNPSIILTNNQAQPVTFNANVTVNGALNYSNMVAQLVAGTGVTASQINTSTGMVVTVNANSQTNGFGTVVTHNVGDFASSANAITTNQIQLTPILVQAPILGDTNHLYGTGFGDTRFNTELTWNPTYGSLGAWTNVNTACVYWNPNYPPYNAYCAYTEVIADLDGTDVFYTTRPGTTPTNGWSEVNGTLPVGNFTFGTNGYAPVGTNYAIRAAAGTFANGVMTNVTISGVLNYSNVVAQLLAGTGITTSQINTATGRVVTVNANSQTNGFGTVVTHNVGEFAASTNGIICNSISVTNPTVASWLTLSVTQSNAVLSIRGVDVAILQTNGVLNAYNGLFTTISNTLPAANVTMNFTNNLYCWTNTTPANVVAYVNTAVCSVGYNGAYLAGPVTNGCITIMLKPSSFISVTNYSASGTSVLTWHPF
jgi:hypothetical protein